MVRLHATRALDKRTYAPRTTGHEENQGRFRDSKAWMECRRLTQAARLEREGTGHHDFQQSRYSSEERLGEARKEGGKEARRDGGTASKEWDAKIYQIRAANDGELFTRAAAGVHKTQEWYDI